ncbi:MAG: SAM-dependent chlorinase/fluorinase [Thaumarchaeota archaeon]|jgi:S-adenosylmethionine hydrolase|nr:SAM-dependent chlorinase/fluorinase [Candidatus Terraquivivens yellowstonensis]
MKRPIVLITDFGEGSIFVGEMKGSILKINPEATIVDLTNRIRPHDISQAAFLLKYSFRYFPENSIFLCVVDPEVGSKRRPIAIRTKNYFFVGPDNGLMYPAASEDGIICAVLLENRKYFLERVSSTFHGRDVFAPVAAHISKGVAIEDFGSKVNSIKELSIEEPKLDSEGYLVLKVMYVDDFGNVITNLNEKYFTELISREGFIESPTILLEAGSNVHKVKLVKCYSEVEENSPLALFDSFGLLEISVNKGNASKYFSLKEGDSIRVKFQNL